MRLPKSAFDYMMLIKIWFWVLFIPLIASGQEGDFRVEQLRSELENFAEEKDSLDPSIAADRWIELVQKYFELSEKSKWQMELGFGEVFNTIPGPQSWKRIHEQVSERPVSEGKNRAKHLGLSLLAQELVGNEKEISKTKRLIIPILSKDDRFYRTALYGMVAEPDNHTDSKQSIFLKHLEYIEKTIAQSKQKKPNAEQTVEIGGFTIPISMFPLEVPDLIAIYGGSMAKDYLLRAIKTNVLLSFKSKKTHELAIELVLENLDKFEEPPWEVLDGYMDFNIVEKIYEQFGLGIENPESAEDFDFTNLRIIEARTIYVLGLLVRDRIKEAREELNKNGPLLYMTQDSCIRMPIPFLYF